MFLQPLHDFRSPANTANFLIMAKGQVNCSFRLKTRFNQSFDTFQYGDNLVFHIQCTAPPNKTVDDLTGKRRMSPFGDIMLIYRHHILMAGKQDRFQGCVFALPGK